MALNQPVLDEPLRMPNVSPAFAVNFFCLSASLPSIETASVAESLPNLVLTPSIVIVVVP
jgi:hypothetical protein